MILNQMSIRCQALISSFLCVAGLLALDSTSARAASVGDWQTTPSLVGGTWDNSSNNSSGNTSTWQMWNGSAWAPESGTTAGTSYPNANTGLITILSGTVITNASASGSTLVASGIIVQTNATFLYRKSVFELAHNDPIDLDVFGAFNLTNSSSGGFSMDTGATIVVESGGRMTNFGTTSGDNFIGNGYGFVGSYVPGAITFRNNSMFVLAAVTNKGTIPAATWQDGSTCLVAPTLATNFVPVGFAGQSFYDFIWNWPNAVGKNGGSADGGSFTVRRNFTFITANGATNEDFPYSGYTLTVGGNISLTNVTWFPTASAGTATIEVGGNFIVAANATISISSASGLGNVIFNGSSPQTLGFYGPNSLGSQGSWDWTVNSGSTVNLDSALPINGTSPDTGGLLNVNGTLNLTANGSISGTSNIITVAPGAILNVSPGIFSFGAKDTLQGAGTITGNVTAGSTSVIYPGTGAPLTFNGSLTYGSATSTNIFNLTSSTSGANDQIVVNGPGGGGSILHPNGAQIVINSAGTLATADYVLFNVTGGGSIANSTFTGPSWSGTTPANSADYYIVISGNQVLLHYSTTLPQPDITSTSSSGVTSPTNLTININNGVSGTLYTVLMSTNIATPLPGWSTVGTFTPSSSGSFSATINGVLNPADPAQFFMLKAP